MDLRRSVRAALRASELEREAVAALAANVHRPQEMLGECFGCAGEYFGWFVEYFGSLGEHACGFGGVLWNVY